MEKTNTAYNTPKDVFLHLFNIIIFYLSIVNFILLITEYISVIFPDALSFYYNGITRAIQSSTSILIISIPVFILTSWMLGKDLKNNPEKREMKLRKWLLYFTLFISALTIIIDLIVFINNFLSGELTIQFFLKILTVLLVAVAVFGYYIWDLKRKDPETSKLPKILAWVISGVVLISIIWGFFILGTPAIQRDRRLDEQRVSNLQEIQERIVNYWTQKEKLPQNLGELEDSISGFIVPQDPETVVSYEYNVTGPLSFELCATFNASSKNPKSISPAKLRSSPALNQFGSLQQNWDHETGKTCFTRTIDPELYKAKLK
ncbi:MAG: DUF5671 domain-containing protein [Patescibacteria group bacterium]|nr:DUF5671 domain-containing protein [Patescibacteria group bacterium]MDD5164832.1 DUF5671 domain-containing protein [Patescibacteria group bacterium]MDD5534689.1 DUF5671 domain-containing protein [Patescibacteria group bacterium]